MVIQNYIDELRKIKKLSNVFEMRDAIEIKLTEFETDISVLKNEVSFSRVGCVDGILKGVCIGIAIGFIISSATYFLTDLIIRV